MALVDYPSSSDEGEPEDAPPPSKASTTANPATALKRKFTPSTTSILPPLPSTFHNLYASTTRLSTHDDPSLHGGRKRVKPHVEGNWPTHIYIEWYPSTSEYDSLNHLISSLKTKAGNENEKINSFLQSDLEVPLPLHISLSRPIGFSTDIKDEFLSSLQQRIKPSGVKPFSFNPLSVDWASNFESTRWFLVLRIKKLENDGLNRLLHICNEIVQDYGEPPLYTQSREGQKKGKSTSQSDVSIPDNSEAFHISIAWILTAPDEELWDVTRMVEEGLMGDVRDMRIGVEEVKVKIGNVVTSITLRKNVMEGKSLFGA